MRLNRDKRYQISALLVVGHQQKVIAKQVGISEGGLSKEISRNGGRKKYDPDKADKRAVGCVKGSFAKKSLFQHQILVTFIFAFFSFFLIFLHLYFAHRR